MDSQHGDHQKTTYSTSADVTKRSYFSNQILMDEVPSNIFFLLNILFHLKMRQVSKWDTNPFFFFFLTF